MPPSSPYTPSSSSLLLPLLLLLLCSSGAADQDCSGLFRAGQENFVLDAEDAVTWGAALLSTAHVLSSAACELQCCQHHLCNLALLEPARTGADTDNRTCVLFNCVHRNRFVCRFVNRVGYQSFIRETVFLKHLQGPQGPDPEAPPIAIAGRDVIVQPGDTVMLNGIESLALGSAHITEYLWSLQSGDQSVKMEKTNLPDQVQLSDLKAGAYIFQLSVTDSNGQSDSTKVTVLVLSPEETALYCLAPLKVGPCRAAFPRWRYDAASGVCQQFTFGGCKKNNNNFLSSEDCLSACKGVTGSSRSVTLPSDEECGSPCTPEQLTCQESGCCVDRSLECDGQKHCREGEDEQHCNKLNQTFSRLLDIDVNQRKARCSEPPHTGPCRASFSRWYYDPEHRKCFRFTYGGCDANGNNFEEENTCSKTCAGVTERNVYFKGLFDRYEKEEESDSGNIALAVLLSVAILALLAILTYCFFKARKKRSHRPVATGPAPLPLSEQDTLVYNSTTKPM